MHDSGRFREPWPGLLRGSPGSARAGLSLVEHARLAEVRAVVAGASAVQVAVVARSAGFGPGGGGQPGSTVEVAARRLS